MSGLPRIVLKKSYWGDDQNFSGLLMRFARGDMRGHIVSHKNDHGASYGRYGALQWWSGLKIDSREIFGASQFSTFATISAGERTSSGVSACPFRANRHHLQFSMRLQLAQKASDCHQRLAVVILAGDWKSSSNLAYAASALSSSTGSAVVGKGHADRSWRWVAGVRLMARLSSSGRL